MSVAKFVVKKFTADSIVSTQKRKWSKDLWIPTAFQFTSNLHKMLNKSNIQNSAHFEFWMQVLREYICDYIEHS